MQNKTYSIAEAAILAGCHHNTIRKAIKAGELPAHRPEIGRFNNAGHGVPWEINADDLAEYLVSKGVK